VLTNSPLAKQLLFMLQGAAQFGRDVQAVAALLAPYTRRPLAHFRELADAATLLALPADHVSQTTEWYVSKILP
jgi:hypothetical protein